MNSLRDALSFAALIAWGVFVLVYATPLLAEAFGVLPQ